MPSHAHSPPQTKISHRVRFFKKKQVDEDLEPLLSASFPPRRAFKFAGLKSSAAGGEGVGFTGMFAAIEVSALKTTPLKDRHTVYGTETPPCVYVRVCVYVRA